MQAGMRRTALPAAALALLAACSRTSSNDQANAGAAANAAGPARLAETVPTQADLAGWLPAPGRHRARAIVLAPPPEAVALRDRMAAAIMRNRAWYDAYVARFPNGELPWHANLGVSEADYRRFVALTRQIGLRERAQVTLTVTRRPDGGLALAADGVAVPLNGIIIYPERGRAETPLGRLGTHLMTGNDSADSPLGRWRGAEWSNRGTGASRPMSLSAGRRAAGDLVLYYNYGPSDAETVILLYPAAAAAGAAR